MLTHQNIWAAIDALAQRHGLTASGLARASGLDATSFNKSKRISPEGRERWPSTESVAKILRSTGATLEDFLRLIEPSGTLGRSMVPLTSTEHAGEPDLFAGDGSPSLNRRWDQIEFPDLGRETVFAMEVAGTALAPLYRDGDVLIVANKSMLRRGDRILACLRSGEVLAREFRRRTASAIEVVPILGGAEESLSAQEVSWTARILWARQ